MKKFAQSLRIIILAIILSLGVTYVFAWTAPTATPPGANTPAPINVSATSQYKAGALGIGGLFHGYTDAIFDGSVGIGTTGAGAKLIVSVPANSRGIEAITSTAGNTHLPYLDNWNYISGLGTIFRNTSNGETARIDTTTGVIRVTGIEMPTGAGAGKVLTSDAGGVASWGVVTGGAGNLFDECASSGGPVDAYGNYASPQSSAAVRLISNCSGPHDVLLCRNGTASFQFHGYQCA